MTDKVKGFEFYQKNQLIIFSDSRVLRNSYRTGFKIIQPILLSKHLRLIFKTTLTVYIIYTKAQKLLATAPAFFPSRLNLISYIKRLTPLSNLRHVYCY